MKLHRPAAIAEQQRGAARAGVALAASPARHAAAARLGVDALAVLGAALVVVEVAARLDVRRERARRAYLGGRLYCRALGHGAPVVFLAGLRGSTSFWGRSFDALATRRQLLFVDALGFGRSPWPPLEYSLDEHLQALRATLREERATDELTFVVHSFGTLLAAHYAARYPPEVARLVLLGTPVFDSEREARARIRAMSPLAATFSLYRPLARASCQLMCALRPVLSRLAPWLGRDVAPEVARDAVQHYWRSFDGTMRHVVLGARVEEALRQLPASVEVVLVHATRDSVTPLPRVRDLAAATAARVVVVDGGHGDYLRHAATIGRLVEAGASRSPTVAASDRLSAAGPATP